MIVEMQLESQGRTRWHRDKKNPELNVEFGISIKIKILSVNNWLND